jgi:uncharacterized protein
MDFEELISNCTGFDWDEGNINKLWERHQVRVSEAEAVFFNEPLLGGEDRKHSQEEQRFYCMGQTNEGRKLFMSFTLRGENKEKIRVISARDQDRAERRDYEQAA